MLARDVHGNGESNYTLTGPVPNSTLSTISAIVSDLRSGVRSMNGNFPSFRQMITSAYAGDLVQRSARLDLFYRDRDGGENYFEIKSPKPNRGQCWEATERLLLVHGLRASVPGHVRAFYGMPYNPYGPDKQSYAWHHATELLDIQNEVLIGEEFWDFVGGPGDIPGSLDLFAEVGTQEAARAKRIRMSRGQGYRPSRNLMKNGNHEESDFDGQESGGFVVVNTNARKRNPMQVLEDPAKRWRSTLRALRKLAKHAKSFGCEAAMMRSMSMRLSQSERFSRSAELTLCLLSSRAAHAILYATRALAIAGATSCLRMPPARPIRVGP